MKRWHIWLGLAISAFFVWDTLRRLRLVEVWQALQGAHYLWLLPGVAVYFLGVWVRAWRWHYLLRPLKPIPTSAMFPVVAIGYMGNNIYPYRAGELLRAYVLRLREDVPVSASLATIVVERIFDGVVMLGFVIFNLPGLAAIAGDSGFVGDIQQVAVYGTIAFAAALVVFILGALFPQQSLALFHRFLEPLLPQRARPKISGILVSFWSGLESLRSPGNVFMVLVSTTVIWLFETGKYWFVMQAFPFTVSFFALMLMNGIVNLATTLPSAPGYLGTFDRPGIAVLEAFGVGRALAAGYTLVLHGALWLPITLLGAYYLTRQRLTWRQVQAEMAKEQPA
ncbi:MAG TPA: lysylphosphatidylglycerol synthase transmembrane domain-containing protein [Anaerolineales bacterium]|nr:lysylphosphatidylglycerol synthase transmembrane domain-containing protein [Anaerolineales bacterium]